MDYKKKRIKEYLKWRQDWKKTSLVDVTNITPAIESILNYIDYNFATPAIYKQYKISKHNFFNKKIIKEKLNIEDFHPNIHSYDLLKHNDMNNDLFPDLIDVTLLDDPFDISALMNLKSLNHFEFISELASMIHSGGAYGGAILDIEGENALQYALKCYKELAVDHKFNDWTLSFYKSGEYGKNWSSWFCDIAWDTNFIICDYNLGIITVFAVTDTD